LNEVVQIGLKRPIPDFFIFCTRDAGTEGLTFVLTLYNCSPSFVAYNEAHVTRLLSCSRWHDSLAAETASVWSIGVHPYTPFLWSL